MSHLEPITLTPPQAAGQLQTTVRCLEEWRKRGFGPPHVKVGRLVRYRRQDIAAWLEANLRQSTSEGGAT